MLMAGLGISVVPTLTLFHFQQEGLATRPEHRMNAHTAFLVWARRLADGVTPPRPQRRARK